jgi:hypothetical protein
MAATPSGPIFVVGCPRSGTTLLQYILRAHPHISMATGESHFIIPLSRRLAEFGDLATPEGQRRILAAMEQQSRSFLETDLHGMHYGRDRLVTRFQELRVHTYPALIDALFMENARGEGKARWADKTPWYVLHMERLIELFPEARFVHLIRDGRDVALSLFRRRHDFQVYNTYCAARYWEIYVARGREIGSRLPHGVYQEFYYEQLINEPRGFLQRLCDFLGEEYSDDLLNYQKAGEVGNRTRRAGDGDGSKTPLLSGPIVSDNHNKWKREFSEAQRRLFERAVGNLLSGHGYAVKYPQRAIPLLTKAAYRGHNRLVQWLSKRP